MNNNWKITKIQAIKSIISLLLFLLFILWRINDHETSGQFVLKRIKKDRFYGRVDSIYRDKWDHNIQKVRLTSGFIYGLYPDWEDKLQIGDSISKKADSTFVEVFKQNGRKIIFDYKELAKGFKD